MVRGRILFFADASNVHTRRWVQAMTSRGFECCVGTRLAGPIAGARVVTIAPGAQVSGWFSGLSTVRRLAREFSPDCIHGHYITSYGMWAATSSDIAPVVLTAWGSDVLVTPRERGWHGLATRRVLTWSLRRASLVTADSGAVLDELVGYKAGAPLHEVLWGVDTSVFRPAALERGAGDGFHVLSVRQWEQNYRIDVVLHAFAALRRLRPALRARLTLLGGGGQEGNLRQLAARLGLDDEVVRFVGRVDEANLVLAMQSADISISVPASDATSVAMLESMACELPVIASDLPANRPWVDASLLVPAGDVDALLGALLQLADNPGLRRQIGRGNRQAVLERAARDRHMDHMAMLYDGLIEPVRGRRT